jgi:LacI family transcriptional regulator
MGRRSEDGAVPRPAVTPRKPRRRPTIQDLARAAATSPSTASRALSGNGYLAAGIEVRLRSAGYHVIVVNNDGEEEAEVEGARTFLAVRVSAAIITPVSDRAVRMLMNDGVPVVQADRMVEGLTSDGVLVDNVKGARQVTDHLIGLGHTRIALLIDETDWTTGAGRLAGYRAALRDAGVPMDPGLVVPTRFQPEAARDAVTSLLDRRPDVTALFAANNMLAEGAFQALQRAGRRIPDDLSLVAFDDVPWMSMVSPGITTVDQHTDDLGRTCAQLVVDRIGGAADGQATVRYIEPSVTFRGSTAPPPVPAVPVTGRAHDGVATSPAP